MNQDTDVLVRVVGLRDGLQNTSPFVSTEAKLAWIRAEFAAGVRLRTGVDRGRLLEVRAIPAAHLEASSLSGALARAGLPRHYQTTAERAAAIH